MMPNPNLIIWIHASQLKPSPLNLTMQLRGLAQMSSLWRNVHTLLVKNIFQPSQYHINNTHTNSQTRRKVFWSKPVFLLGFFFDLADKFVSVQYRVSHVRDDASFWILFAKFTEKYILEKNCNQKPKALRVTLYCLIKMTPSVVVPRHLECKCIFLRVYNS